MRLISPLINDAVAESAEGAHAAPLILAVNSPEEGVGFGAGVEDESSLLLQLMNIVNKLHILRINRFLVFIGVGF